MAKKIKFPLKLKNDFPARTLDELRKHFDLDKIVAYFLDGKLLTWLESRYYEIEAKAVRELNKTDDRLPQKLAQIFGIVNPEIEECIDLESVEERNRKLGILRQYTSDPVVLEQVASVAFNQEDLGDLLDDGVQNIYLCNNSFVIPLSVENKTYTGIGNVEAVIRSEELVDFKAKNIEFQNIHFNETYEKLVQKENYSPEILYQKGLEAEKNKDYSLAFSLYQQAADKSYPKAYFKLGYFYYQGLGVNQSYLDAHDCYIKAANAGDTWAMNNLSVLYFNGQGVPQNCSEGRKWLEKAVDNGNNFSLYWKARYRLAEKNGYTWKYIHDGCMDDYRAFIVADIITAANNGCVEAMLYLGECYLYENSCTSQFYDASYKWYKKAADLGNAEAMYQLSCHYLRTCVHKRFSKVWI